MDLLGAILLYILLFFTTLFFVVSVGLTIADLIEVIRDEIRCKQSTKNGTNICSFIQRRNERIVEMALEKLNKE